MNYRNSPAINLAKALREETIDHAAIMQSWINGVDLEFRNKSEKDAKWGTASAPNWDFKHFDYRVKKIPREFFINVHDNGHYYAYASQHSADAHKTEGRVSCLRVQEVTED